MELNIIILTWLKSVFLTFTEIYDEPGCRLADVLYNEHLSRVLVKTLSANKINAQILESKSKSLFFVHQLRVTYLRQDQELHRKSTKDVRRDQDFKTVFAFDPEN